ncbi:hypothetical protein BCR42DRAFT_399146 [Absidia repens]|uniref:Uncharacterized protein n=1 Tax=Absidia repens TaxID=90262 RepID=A0A1X2HE32_9FUNG|nr:hypothetical protein BCR42DRAFT_399146 [Absidia repens]
MIIGLLTGQLVPDLSLTFAIFDTLIYNVNIEDDIYDTVRLIVFLIGISISSGTGFIFMPSFFMMRQETKQNINGYNCDHANTAPTDIKDTNKRPDYVVNIYEHYRYAYATCYDEIKNGAATNMNQILDFYRLCLFTKGRIEGHNLDKVLCFQTVGLKVYGDMIDVIARVFYFLLFYFMGPNDFMNVPNRNFNFFRNSFYFYAMIFHDATPLSNWTRSPGIQKDLLNFTSILDTLLSVATLHRSLKPFSETNKTCNLVVFVILYIYIINQCIRYSKCQTQIRH